MLLADFNAAPVQAARAVVQPCADIPWWVGAVVGGRPYADRETLIEWAGKLAHDWASGDVTRALAQHPRIGERHRGPAAEAALSAREQGGVGEDRDVQQRLRRLNEEYEATFGHVFLIRAAGRQAPEILAELIRRLANDPEAERIETALQLREIALLRLHSALH